MFIRVYKKIVAVLLCVYEFAPEEEESHKTNKKEESINNPPHSFITDYSPPSDDAIPKPKQNEDANAKITVQIHV